MTKKKSEKTEEKKVSEETVAEETFAFSAISLIVAMTDILSTKFILTIISLFSHYNKYKVKTKDKR